MAAGFSVDLDRWRLEFDELMPRVAPGVEPRRRMAGFVRGLLAGLPRVNCWSIAEHAGDLGPRGMQRLQDFAAEHGWYEIAAARYFIEHGWTARRRRAELAEVAEVAEVAANCLRRT